MQRPDSLDDVDGILVYADQLMARDDPHGQLIAFQHGKKTRQAKSWLAKHAPAILGELATTEHVSVEWQSGFIRKASLTEWERGAPTLVALYDQLRASPAAQLIVELQLDQAPMGAPCKTKQGYCYEAVLARMAKHPLPTLRDLHVGADVNKPEYNCMHGLARVLPKHPGLETIGLSGGVYDFGSPKLPKLRELQILADHDGSTIRKLARAHLPALEKLDLHGSGTTGDPPTAADYAKLFASELPALRRLVFSTYGEVFVEACRALLRSPLLRQLEELRIDFIDNAIADLVLEDPTPLRHVKRLAFTAFDRSELTASRRKRLQAALPKLKIGQ